MVAVNPLHAPPLPLDRVEPSPYYPSSRRWNNPLALRIEDLPGRPATPRSRRRAPEARRLNAAPRRPATGCGRSSGGRWTTVIGARPDLPVRAVAGGEGGELETYARFCALAEHHGSGWRALAGRAPAPVGAPVAAFAAGRVRPGRRSGPGCSSWSTTSWRRRAEEPPLLTDLAIGVDPDGADAWACRTCWPRRAGGRPARRLQPRVGQDWGLPPFIPHALREAGYEPLRRLWRA